MLYWIKKFSFIIAVLCFFILFFGAIIRLMFHRSILYFIPITLMILVIVALLIWPNIVSSDAGGIVQLMFLVTIGFGVAYAIPFGFLYPSTESVPFRPHVSLHDIVHDDHIK